MSLVVESGAGLANADSYVSLADAASFHNGLGNTAWLALGTTLQEQALRKATTYMRGEYRLRWLGKRMTETQSLDWPRSEVLRRDSVLGTYLATDVVPHGNQRCLLPVGSSCFHRLPVGR